MDVKMNVIEIIKTSAPLIVSILIVFLNHFFSLSKTKKELQNKLKIEEQKDKKNKAYELIEALLSIERLDTIYINKMSLSLFSNQQLPPNEKKDLELGSKELNNELLKSRSIAHFYFPEIINECNKIEKLHEEIITQFMPKKIAINSSFAKNLDCLAEKLHDSIIKIIHNLRDEYNPQNK